MGSRGTVNPFELLDEEDNEPQAVVQKAVETAKAQRVHQPLPPKPAAPVAEKKESAPKAAPAKSEKAPRKEGDRPPRERRERPAESAGPVSEEGKPAQRREHLRDKGTIRQGDRPRHPRAEGETDQPRRRQRSRERQSGTGEPIRGTEKRGGRGPRNWGAVTDQGSPAEAHAEAKAPTEAAPAAEGEAAAPAADAAAAAAAPAAEPQEEDKSVSFSDFMKKRAEDRVSAASVEERKPNDGKPIAGELRTSTKFAEYKKESSAQPAARTVSTVPIAVKFAPAHREDRPRRDRDDRPRRDDRPSRDREERPRSTGAPAPAAARPTKSIDLKSQDMFPALKA